MASVIVILSPLLKALSVLWFISRCGGGVAGEGVGGGSLHTDRWLNVFWILAVLGRFSRDSREAEDAVRQNHHCCNSPNRPSSVSPKTNKKKERKRKVLSETGSLTLLWPYWAHAGAARGGDSARSGPTLLNALTQDDRLFCVLFCFFFFFCYIFMIFVMLLGSYSF